MTPIQGIKNLWFWGIFILTSTFPTSKIEAAPRPGLHSDLRYLVELRHSEGDLSYAQLQYIINELEPHPNCEEISQLFGHLELYFEEIRERIRKSCSKKRTVPQGRLVTQIHHRIEGMEDAPSPLPGWKIKAKSRGVHLNVQASPQTPWPQHRSVSLNHGQWTAMAGHIVPPGSIPLVLGRRAWPGPTSTKKTFDPIFGGTRRLNGLYLESQGSYLQNGLYGYWNKFEDTNTLTDASLLGFKSEADLGKVSLTLQSQWMRYEHSKNFGLLQGGLGGKIKTRGGVSNLNMVFSKDVNDKEAGTGGILEFLQRKGSNSSFRIYQTLGSWNNPLAAPRFKMSSIQVMEVLMDSAQKPIPLEGGIGMRLKFRVASNSNWNYMSDLKLKTDLHWDIDRRDALYRSHNAILENQLGTFWINGVIKNKYREDYNFTEPGIFLGKKGERFEASAAWYYKLGTYGGKYPSPLSLNLGTLNSDWGVRARLLFSDIRNLKESQDLYLVQSIKFPGVGNLETTLRIPFWAGKLGSSLYGGIRFSNPWGFF